MATFEALQSGKEKIAAVGLGYVGLPLAVALARHFDVIGFDIKDSRIAELKTGYDRTREVTSEILRSTNIELTSDSTSLQNAHFIIIAVPTPVNADNLPDLSLVEGATKVVAKELKEGSVVVYESTVYPGVTEDICVPILEKISGLQARRDFKVGYSPERINPGDTEHTIDKVIKVVAGMDAESTELIAQVYGSITTVFKAASIKVAEAAKVIENTQRDINIALMNELALIFQKMGISIYDVLAAAGTKWNFLKFVPGLVGGHCIGVDPYYLTYKAQQLGYQPEVILSGRRINDAMPGLIVETIMQEMARLGKDPNNAQVLFCGITFKENVPDSRNSKAAEIVRGLSRRDIAVTVCDPLAYPDEVQHEYGINLTKFDELPRADVLIVAVGHDTFKESINIQTLSRLVNPGALIVDIKHILSSAVILEAGYHYWSL